MAAPLDANTVALWRFAKGTDATVATDETGTYTLTLRGTTSWTKGIIKDAVLSGAAGTGCIGQGTAAAGTALQGNFSVDGWLCVYPGPAANICTYLGTNFTTNAADIPLLDIGITAERVLRLYQRSSLSTGVSLPFGTPLDPLRWYHLGITRTLTPGNTATFRFYVDGQFVAENTGVAVPSTTVEGGATHYWGLGCYRDNLDRPAGIFSGALEDWRVSNVVRTDADMQALYGAVHKAAPPPDVPPTVSILEPAPGTKLAATSHVRVRVTDPEGFRQVLIMVAHVGGTLEEVAFNGTHFSAAYAQSERQVVTNGWDFVLRRAGGWHRTGFTLRVLPVDLMGQGA